MKGNDVNLGDVINEHVNIIDIISGYVPLKRMGKNYKGLCPFHNEKTASFIVSEDKQLYHCFGCGAAGNSIGFIMAIENLDFLDAVELLSDRYNIDISQYRRKKYDPIARDHSKELQETTRQAAVFYFKNLKENQASNQYLLNRGLTEETIKTFGLGYALDSWDSLIKHCGSNKATLDKLDEAGLIIKRNDGSGYYDRFRNRIIFPIIDVKGKVIGFGGRVMDDSLPKYLNSPETPIFNKSRTLYGLNIAKNHLDKTKTVIVTEGYMDVIALHNHGINNVVATLGTALTKEHGRILDRYAEEIVVCYDSDEAGMKAAMRSIEVLSGIKAKVKILSLGEGMDPDEYIKAHGRERFLMKLFDAQPAVIYRLEALMEDYDFISDDGQIEYSKKAIEVINTLESDLDKEKCLETLNKKSNIKSSYLNHIRNAVIKNKGQTQSYNKPNVVRTNAPTADNPQQKIEKRLLEIALESKKGFELLMENFELETIENFTIFNIMTYLVKYYANHEKFDLSNAVDDLDMDLALIVEKVCKNKRPIENMGKEIRVITTRHKISQLEDKINKLKKERADFDKLKHTNAIDHDEVAKIQKDFTVTEMALRMELVALRKKL